MSSWREAAGREGDDAYKFGDLSRSLLRRTSAIAQATKETGSRVVQRASDTFSHEDRPASTLTWKESAGRDDGDDAYAFGDLSRTVVKKIGGGEAARASRLDAIFAAGCVEIKSSTLLQCERMRHFRRKLFGCASRTR